MNVFVAIAADSQRSAPFDRYQEAFEKVLGRPVFTHEFADLDKLCADYERAKNGEPLQGPDFSILNDKAVILMEINDMESLDEPTEGPNMTM